MLAFWAVNTLRLLSANRVLFYLLSTNIFFPRKVEGESAFRVSYLRSPFSFFQGELPLFRFFSVSCLYKDHSLPSICLNTNSAFIYLRGVLPIAHKLDLSSYQSGSRFTCSFRENPFYCKDARATLKQQQLTTMWFRNHYERLFFWYWCNTIQSTYWYIYQRKKANKQLNE